ncbi:hypothetical protein [Fictibacillus phosphorivorans]|uniref:hypothetical protein n=1 Tax=Fictibacillus phosphorivorans TaxID=1221500 RepID=UPI00203B323E|nr:hypothetical protein [Fictibacillus phosphorivorans]MCM3717659.1 hypothetical protein [Fictibacillus phosphorivorans]MCM3775559.1 hypothetical protein [Fictibacillus phosphorivorans]
MENRLKDLNRIVDKEISKTPVFTEKDERNILSAINNTKTSPSQINKKPRTIIPRLLTAALFAGVIFTSYTMVDNYLTPKTTMENKKDKKPEVRYAQEFTQTSNQLTYDVSTQELTVKGMVKNTTDYDSEPFQAKVNILSDELATSLGTQSLDLNVPLNKILKPNESYSFEKVIPLNLGVVDENTFKDALEVEIYSKTKTLTSFVLDQITYEEVPVKESVKEPAETEEPPVQQDPEPPAKEEITPNQEEKLGETSLADLEEKYGKKKTPFEKLTITVENGTLYFNGITVGMKSEEINHILGPYDEHSISHDDYEGHNLARWKVKTNDNLYVHYEDDPSNNYTARMLLAYLNENELKELTARFGEPYYENSNGFSFYYLEDSQQLLSIYDGSLLEKKDFEGYQLILRFEDHPEMLKRNVPPKES